MINSKNIFFLIFFRTSNFFTKHIVLRILGLPVRLTYKIIFQWVLGIDIPDTTKLGKNFVLFHGHSLVINKDSVIGNNVVLRHSTTIGNAFKNGKSPILKDGVNVGSNSVIIGSITIGENSIIGAGSVVVSDVPANSIVVGNPAKVVKNI